MQNDRQPLILIVDDEESVRLPIRFTLENFGFDVIEAASGAEVLDVLADQRPDLILLDIVMDGLDGLETCMEIRQRPGGGYLPVIMMTGLEDEKTIIESFDAGATDFVAKPLNLLVLGYRVRYWLRSSNALTDLHRSEQRLSKAQQIAKLGQWEWNLDTGDILVSSNSPETFGLTRSTTFTELIKSIHEDDRVAVKDELTRAKDTKEPFNIQYRIAVTGNEDRILMNQGEFLEDEASGEWQALGTVQDITEMKHVENKIRYLAFYDSLTGLANRSLFREHWKKLYAMNLRNPNLIAFMFIDLDHFKQINDSLGHNVGDSLLIIVAERLKATLRESDVIARSQFESESAIISRVGGDEFTLLTANLTSPENAAKLAERILDSLSEPFEVGAHQLNISGSIGISIFPDDGHDLDTLLRHADTAMYEAKKKGRNNYQFFHSAMNDAVQARFLLQNRLHRALDERELVLYYQPKYSNKGGKIKGVEALIRWMDPERGLIQPNDFLPFAEETNFIYAINDWVILEACKQAMVWVEQGIFNGCLMSINISGKSIDFMKLYQTICSCLKNTGLDPHYLEVELTERVMMQKTDDAREVLSSLREMGVSVAIDDFGTGYSALSHLQVFPLTTLKIDKSFIDNIERTENGASLLLSIIQIAKSLNLKVIAEGVETESQKTALGKMECDELQGFLLSVPVVADTIEKLLLKSGRDDS
jgi:diguanylate cyclase (GGDEF)-like protein